MAEREKPRSPVIALRHTTICMERVTTNSPEQKGLQKSKKSPAANSHRAGAPIQKFFDQLRQGHSASTVATLPNTPAWARAAIRASS
jgi:hypothetical protein